MDQFDRLEVKENAERWAREARELIVAQMKETFSITTKAHQHDLVTDVDKNVEKFFLDKISHTYSDHRLMGEEGSFEEIKNLDGVVWILDPIDGTINFVQQKSNFAISIGIFQDGVPIIGLVYDVMRDEMFLSLKGEGATLNGIKIEPIPKVSLNESLLSFNAGWMLKDRKLEWLLEESRGIRSYGVASLEMAYVACGRLEAYISFNLAPWDMAGGYALLQEVGGIVTNYNGDPLTFLEKDTMIAANPWVYKEITEVLNRK
ncbi:inositol monophosphatase [Salipaludibacillus neizhouensis]|uniref:inositol-phosphate phosphatase n=1 Tax=Salipaludibacillus neizhouensis TaxID=885475 RepID=A0A3A9KFN8_9BACI|nr:inositol monophosphatase family protein [Salipaludibacillus neizhouensis]RKL69392.1 inositol monophosphatase [Salipaludibacillus neizhouensis]